MPAERFPLGIFSWFGLPMPGPARVAAIRRAGFSATSVWWDAEKYGARLYEYPALIRAEGLFLENAHVPFHLANHLWSSDAVVRQAAVEQHLRWIEDLARFAIPMLVMHITTGENPPAITPEGMDGLLRIVAAAEAAGITLAIENTRRWDYLERVFAEIPSPALGLCYDSSHDWLYRHDQPLPPAVITRLVATHFSDNAGYLDNHWLPFQGCIPWETLLPQLPWASYTGWLFLEVVPTAGKREQDPVAFLGQAYQAAVRLREMILRISAGAEA